MRVKLFSKKEGYFKKNSTASTEFEQEINSWLQANPSIKIIEIKQSSSGGSLEPAIHLISVWYNINN